MSATAVPVLFVHGLWLHATSWAPWASRFQEAGHTCLHPGWPGEPDTVEEARAHPEAVAGRGIDEVVAHFTEAAKSLATPPVAVGHSFGGLIALRLLHAGVVSAAVAIDPAPIRGVYLLPPSALRVASAALRNPGNRKRSVSLTRAQFRYGFGNALTESESDALHERWAIPSPGRPLFQAATANLSRTSAARVDTRSGDRGPLLLVSGGRDRTVPPAIVERMRRMYAASPAPADFRSLPDRGHSLVVDAGWPELADAVLAWIGEKVPAPTT